MIGRYSVGVLYFAGRKPFMELNIPILAAEKTIDVVHICVNTDNAVDVEYIESIPKIYGESRFVLHYLPNELKNFGNNPPLLKYWYFYRFAADHDAIYFKIDDDVVYFSKDFFKKMLDVRLKNPQYLFIYPNTINNPLCNCLNDSIDMDDLDAVKNHMYETWRDPEYALTVHRKFAVEDDDKYFKPDFIFDDKYSFILPEKNINIRASINAICFYGYDMYNWLMLKITERAFKWCDEQFFTSTVYQICIRKSLILNSVACSHYSFGIQHKAMLPYQAEILGLYSKKLGK